MDVTKACGPDSVSNQALKSAASDICTSLCRLFNLSLFVSKIPQEWKIANVTPVYEKGTSSVAIPVYIFAKLYSTFKVQEKLVHQKLYHFLEPFLSDAQSGFKLGDFNIVAVNTLHSRTKNGLRLLIVMIVLEF